MRHIIFNILLFVFALATMTSVSIGQESKNSEKTNPFVLKTTTESNYKIGQVWSYKTRPNEQESTFTVLKIDSNAEYGNIINIALNDLKIKNPESPSGFTNEVKYSPFTEKAIDASAVELLREKGDLPDFTNGYNSWKKRFETEKSGVYTFTIAEAINFLEVFYNARRENFLISSKMKPKWVSIEYDNPNCQPLLNYNNTNLELVIPIDGFICTSSPIYMRAYRRNYFLVDEKGNRTLINAEELIRHESASLRNEPSSDVGQPDCNVRINQFFYGSEDDLRKAGTNSIFQVEKFLVNYHPVCRNTGISVPKREP